MADEEEENEDDPAIGIRLVFRRLGVGLERVIAIARADYRIRFDRKIIVDISCHGVMIKREVNIRAPKKAYIMMKLYSIIKERAVSIELRQRATRARHYLVLSCM